MLLQFIAGLVLAIVISFLAWKTKNLSMSGAYAAAILGTIIFGLGGLAWAVLLLGFFISSSLLSRAFGRHKASLAEKFSKGSQRDAGQVMANGGVAGGMVLIGLLFPDSTWVWAAFAGALAAVNADTWATELGVLSRSLPVMIHTGKPVEKGTSGAISLAGTFSALSGAALIGGLAISLWQGASALDLRGALLWMAAISLAGLTGSLVDSFLGATIQAIYHCPSCHKETERHPTHTCGSPTSRLRGLAWMDNDLVNSICSLAGAASALVFGLLIFRLG